MIDGDFFFSHRQLVSGLIALVLGEGGGIFPVLGELGYELNALEIPMVDSNGDRFVPDLHLVKRSINLSLLVDCKGSPASISEAQTACYLNIQGVEVVRQGRVTIRSPQSHRVDAAFFVLSASANPMMSVLNRLLASGGGMNTGVGLVRIDRELISLELDSLSDPNLSDSLGAGWAIRFSDLPLERLPFESSTPNWELAQVLLQTLASYFFGNRGAFDIDDVCQDSNPFWPYLSDQHDHIRGRITRMIVSLRGSAFKGWLVKVPGPTQKESRWRFEDRATDRANVQVAFQRRASKYIELVRQNLPPTPNDFRDIDQLPLPLVLTDDEI